LAQDKSHEAVGSDAKVVLKTTTTMIDKPLALPQTDKPEVTMMAVTMQPNGHTSLHKHPSPTMGYVIEGAVEVRAEGVVKTVKMGDAFLEPIEGSATVNMMLITAEHTRIVASRFSVGVGRTRGGVASPVAGRIVGLLGAIFTYVVARDFEPVIRCVVSSSSRSATAPVD
jgi:quercetin dioxygenase-like cupin family protein